MNHLATKPADLSVVVPLHRPSISSKAACRALASFGHTPTEIAQFLRISPEDVAALYQDDLDVGKTQLLLKLKSSMVERALGHGQQAQKAAEYLVNNLSDWGDDKSTPSVVINNTGEKPVINVAVVPTGQFFPREE
jgi:hypothetical protein